MTDDQAIQEIFASEDSRFAALVDGNIVALQNLLADDLHYVHATGSSEDKGEFIRKISSAERRYRLFEVVTRKAHREGGFIFVFGKVNIEVERAVGTLKDRFTYTAIYREGPSPRLLAWQATTSPAG